MLDLPLTAFEGYGASAPRPNAGAGFYFKALRHVLGAKPVLNGVNIEVPPGQFLAVVGGPGSGKSTFLRLLAGLDVPETGQIARGPGAAGPGGIRLMFQEPRLLPWAPLIENVALGLTGLASGREARLRAQAILADVGLAGQGDQSPSALSNGQKQRVALARALIAAPKLLALDAPFEGLEPAARLDMHRLLERAWVAQGFTAVLASRDIAEAVLLADRVVVLKAGQIALDLAIDLPRPRRPGSAEGQALAETIRAAARA